MACGFAFHRCGMIYMQPTACVGTEAQVQSWLDKLLPFMKPEAERCPLSCAGRVRRLQSVVRTCGLLRVAAVTPNIPQASGVKQHVSHSLPSVWRMCTRAVLVVFSRWGRSGGGGGEGWSMGHPYSL